MEARHCRGPAWWEGYTDHELDRMQQRGQQLREGIWRCGLVLVRFPLQVVTRSI